QAPAYDRAIDARDWPGAIAAAQSVLDVLATEPEGPELAKYAKERFALPHMAYALALAGRLEEAEKIAGPLPEDCYLCLRTRGKIAALAGNWPEAERTFGEAVKQNPRFPFADLEWGHALLAKGDAPRAIEHFKAAAQDGPRFADPLEQWGEALM